jgi:hypothetical protein
MASIASRQELMDLCASRSANSSEESDQKKRNKNEK